MKNTFLFVKYKYFVEYYNLYFVKIKVVIFSN